MSRPLPSDAVLERLTSLHPKLIDLSLGRIERLLAALGHPETRLPPVIHVAGTNGKGSTIAFMRAVAEAAGLSVHVYTSPHLVRFHERIVVNGAPVAEAELAAILEECEDANGGAPVTFFEITTAAAFLAFSRRPADLLLLETGLGGRLDATNVLAKPELTVITPISIDHTGFLGENLADIAFEKAGILKPGVPCIVAPQEPEALGVVERQAARTASPLEAAGAAWEAAPCPDGMVFRDRHGALRLPPPALAGPHQVVNAGTALAVLRRWRPEAFGRDAAAAGLSSAAWPGRFQRLGGGPFAALAGGGCELWIDGGHNPAAGQALAGALAGLEGRPPAALVCAMQANKDADGFLRPFAGIVDRVIATALPPGAEGLAPDRLAAAARAAGIPAETAPTPESAVELAAHARQCRRIVLCGSLYLVGAVLAAGGPDGSSSA